MKKNSESKWIVLAIIFAVLAIAVNVFSIGASAKEEEVEEQPEGKLTHVAVWLSEKNGKDWDDGLSEIEEMIREEYETMEWVTTHYHNVGSKLYWVELTYETEGGIVTGRIYDHR